MAQTYHYLAASERFLHEHIVEEVLEERRRDYLARNKPIDFWLVRAPAFLEALGEHRCPLPAAAIVSTDGAFILWLKHRLQYVLMGSFEAPSPAIPDPLATSATVR
ncbi:MgPME-cyclase complex family protein [Gloeobacter kilaueensis]|uniref:Uncharacterized protein n=1 Tax=Gloeobacter kilaueensis (strain ATCC BAA-2537 / CCAP 1431/1 / ULC 316 / JS1) TaxID=1183438 RepID=U5QIB5_GLOK1|nr:MgPME-cyclase complex family protein [Gloeobacter kilaueensis]AGY58681.1 hypothetical protein GKIL_2435 [Gloeobacter kilaueensis JS1]